MVKTGNWFICDVCGFKVHSSDIRKRWDNLMVCPADFETRHPSDFPIKIPVEPIVKDARPRPVGQHVTDVYPNGVTKDDL